MSRTIRRCSKCKRPTDRPYAKFCNSCSGCKWAWFSFTPAMDDEIRRAYAARENRGRLALEWNIPEWKIGDRARHLGVARVREKLWSPEEEKILGRNCHLSPGVIQARLRERGFQRSKCSIVMKRKRSRFSRPNRGCSANALAAVMGVDLSTVLRWIHRGLLKAQRLPSDRPAQQVASQGEWLIRPRCVREFIIASTAHVDLRGCDKYWLVDLLTNELAEAA